MAPQHPSLLCLQVQVYILTHKILMHKYNLLNTKMLKYTYVNCSCSSTTSCYSLKCTEKSYVYRVWEIIMMYTRF